MKKSRDPANWDARAEVFHHLRFFCKRILADGLLSRIRSFQTLCKLTADYTDAADKKRKRAEVIISVTFFIRVNPESFRGCLPPERRPTGAKVVILAVHFKPPL
jgi:hypothetical protein